VACWLRLRAGVWRSRRPQRPSSSGAPASSGNGGRTSSSSGRLRPWRLWSRTGLGCGSGITHRLPWRRALQNPRLRELFPQIDHSAADRRPRSDGSPRIAVSGRQRERSNAGSRENLYGGCGQAAGRHSVWRAAEPGYLGRSGAVVDMAIRMYFLHKTFPGSCGSRIYHSAPSITFSARTRYPALRM